MKKVKGGANSETPKLRMYYTSGEKKGNPLTGFYDKMYEAHPIFKEGQLVGGFEIPDDIDQNVEKKIYTRLNTIAKDNLVAVSEIGSIEPYRRPDELNSSIDINCTNDTSFIGKGIKNTENCSKSNHKILTTSSGHVILSVHLSSGGPISDKKSDQSIATFLGKELPNLTKVDIIVGDSNITPSKCVAGASIMSEISEALSIKYGGNWVVIMSSTPIEKNRKGFMLLNQQANKSTNKTISETDGTFIAIKYEKTNPKVGEELSQNSNIKTEFKKNDFQRIYMFDKRIDTSKNIKEPVKFLTFDKSSDAECIDKTKAPLDVVFIDHAVVHVSKSFIKSINPSIVFPWENLVAINLGSVINSGTKNWNLKHIGKYKEIKALDKELYEAVHKKMIPDEKVPNSRCIPPEYENLNGSDFDKDCPFDKFLVNYDKELNEEIDKISEALNTLLKPEVIAGGRLSKKIIKSKRNSKRNSKSKKNKTK